MVEVIDSNIPGHKVLRVNGRLLASRFNPVEEARQWLDRRSEFLTQVKTVIVLGLGSGYHLDVILKECAARIIVLEQSSEVIEKVNEIRNIDSTRIQIEHLESARQVKAMESIRQSVKHSFVVLVHPASFAQNSELYREVRDLLIGREWGGLQWQWYLAGGPELDAVPSIAATEAPLTIYDLEQTELVQNSSERERLLIQALRELVK